MLYNLTHFPGPLVCRIRQVLTCCTIWHISPAPWCVGLDWWHAVQSDTFPPVPWCVGLDRFHCSIIFAFSLIKFQFLMFASGKFYFMLCYFMLSYHISLSHLNTSRFPIWKTCNNHTRSKFPNFFGWLRLARVNKSNTFWKIPQHRGENVKSLWKYPGRIKNSTNLIRNVKMHRLSTNQIPGYLYMV
jgi:hypothetical protein